MRYLSLLQGTSPATPPPPELFEAIMTLGQEASASGALLDMGGLQPGSTTQVSVHAAELSIVDGPFTETKELLSYAIYEVRSKAEAVEWTRRFMAIHRDLWPEWSGDSHVVPIMGGPPAG
jgi:hypothetical protein